MSTTKNFTYRNKTDKTLTFIGVGVVKGGATVTSKTPIDNPNLILVVDDNNDVKKTKADKPAGSK